MPDIHTLNSPENASMTRRALLTGGAAVAVAGLPAVAAAALDDDDNFDELMMMLDLHDELDRQHHQAIGAYERIDRMPGQPQDWYGIGLLEFFGQEHTERYYRGHSLTFLTANPERVSFHDFFKEQIELAQSRAKLGPECADWPAVKAQDYAKVTAEIGRQMEARMRWEAESGLAAAHRELMGALDAVCDLEHRICETPVRSLRDLRLKIDLVKRERWMIDESHLREIVLSMAGLTGNGGAA